jgi:hypothetical protein
MSIPATNRPDLGPDVDRGTNVVAAYIVSCTLAFIFVLLRFWSRSRVRGLGADDWCMLLTFVYTPYQFHQTHTTLTYSGYHLCP